MREQRQKHRIDRVLLLLLFAVFAATILLVLVSGSDIVQRMTVRDQSSFEQRTAVQYLTARVRQADQRGMVDVRSFGDGDALVLTEEIEGDLYETLVYCSDGYLRELFVEAGLEMDAEFGEEILPIQAVRFQHENTHIRAQLTLAGGEEEELILSLRSERGTMQ